MSRHIGCQPCGCDPGARWHCTDWPDCGFGRTGGGYEAVQDVHLKAIIDHPASTCNYTNIGGQMEDHGRDIGFGAEVARERARQASSSRPINAREFNEAAKAAREHDAAGKVAGLSRPEYEAAQGCDSYKSPMGSMPPKWDPLETKKPEGDIIGPTRATSFPADAAGRKQHPVASGVLDYFPDAIVAVSRVSHAGNEQHNPGQPLHWARNKSADEADALMRHFLERGTIDSDGIRHTAKLAWRALAMLQKEIESSQKGQQ